METKIRETETKIILLNNQQYEKQQELKKIRDELNKESLLLRQLQIEKEWPEPTGGETKFYCQKHQLQCSTQRCFLCRDLYYLDEEIYYTLKTKWNYHGFGYEIVPYQTPYYQPAENIPEETVFIEELKKIFDIHTFKNIEIGKNKSDIKLKCPGEYGNRELGLRKGEQLKLVCNRFGWSLHIPTYQKNQWKKWMFNS